MSEIDHPQGMKTSPFGAMHWFLGVVEDRNDPEQAGRVRVRCLGVHSESTADVPTDQLPWALVAISPTSGAGIGHSPTGIVPGSWVVGFFLDGKYAQQPVVTGSIFGIPAADSAPMGGGFVDPAGTFPRNKDEPEVSRIARGTAPTARPAADGAIGAPGSAYAAKYPFNKVIETETGHVIELDDTEGAERIFVMHKSGSYTEFYPDGTVVSHAAKDQFRTVMGDDAIHVAGNVKVIVDGDANLSVSGNVTSEVGGALDAKVAGDANVSTGNLNASAKDVTIRGSGKVNVIGNGLNIRSSGSATIRGSSSVTIQAPKINLRGKVSM